jgi:Ca-activated chloride channel family protein
MLLRDSRYKGQASFDGAAELARASTGTDLRGYRTEFVRLVETARSLSARESASR